MRTLRKRYYAKFWIQPISVTIGYQINQNDKFQSSLQTSSKQCQKVDRTNHITVENLLRQNLIQMFFLVSWNDGFINHCKVFNDTVFSYRGFVCHRVTGVESIWLTVVCCFVHSVAAAHKIGGPWLANFAWNQYKVSYKLGSQIRKPFLGCNAWEEMYSWWWEGGSWCHQ